MDHCYHYLVCSYLTVTALSLTDFVLQGYCYLALSILVVPIEGSGKDQFVGHLKIATLCVL